MKLIAFVIEKWVGPGLASFTMESRNETTEKKLVL